MYENPLFFQRQDTRLFGVLHRPTAIALKTAFVLSHPFAEEKLWSHRVFVSLARELSRLGYTTLRFDYMGAGDSSGTTVDTSLDTHLADLGAAVDVLLDRHPDIERVGMVGLRLG